MRTGINDSSAGLIPRALQHLFAKISEVTSEEDRQHCRIIMSYVEIYNERLHDLLQPYKPNARLDPQVMTSLLEDATCAPQFRRRCWFQMNAKTCV